jgi:hypothetical protein
MTTKSGSSPFVDRFWAADIFSRLVFAYAMRPQRVAQEIPGYQGLAAFTSIQRSAWKWNPANFAPRGYSEVYGGPAQQIRNRDDEPCATRLGLCDFLQACVDWQEAGYKRNSIANLPPRAETRLHPRPENGRREHIGPTGTIRPHYHPGSRLQAHGREASSEAGRESGRLLQVRFCS